MDKHIGTLVVFLGIPTAAAIVYLFACLCSAKANRELDRQRFIYDAQERRSRSTRSVLMDSDSLPTDPLFNQPGDDHQIQHQTRDYHLYHHHHDANKVNHNYEHHQNQNDINHSTHHDVHYGTF
jgi:hypothetical protein